MEAAGADMAVLHMASVNLFGIEFCTAMNNGNARVAKEYPGKFVPLKTGPDVMKELECSRTKIYTTY